MIHDFLNSFEWEFLRENLQYARLAIFAMFVALGLAVRFSSGARRRVCINLFLVYLLFVNAFVVLAGTDSWPFSHYPMMASDTTDPDPTLGFTVFRLVYSDGSESRIDPIAFSPSDPQTIMIWLKKYYSGLSPRDQNDVLRFLYDRAEAARRNRFEGRRFGNDLLLGRFAAPHMDVYWDAVHESDSAAGLRLYWDSWRPAELVRNEDAFERRLIGEYLANDGQ